MKDHKEQRGLMYPKSLTPHRRFLAFGPPGYSSASLDRWEDSKPGLVSGLLHDGREIICVCFPSGKVLMTTYDLRPEMTQAQIIEQLRKADAVRTTRGLR